MPIFCKKRPFSKKHAALKFRFCQKNGRSLKNTAPMSFFQNFHDKPPAFKTLFGQKNVNTVKITL